MLIAIEGCDGSGKSTLVQMIADELDQDCDIFHRKPPRRHPLEEYELDLQTYRPGPIIKYPGGLSSRISHSRNIICDRLHWGEPVYGKVIRGTSLLDGAQFLHVEMFLQIRGALMLWLDLPPEIALFRAGQRTQGEKFLSPELFTAIREGYRELAPRSIIQMRRIALTSEADAKGAVLQASLLEDDVRHFSFFQSLIGNPKPKLLILGEKHSGFDHRFTSAFTPHPQTSGHYLMRAIPEKLRGKIAIANACEENVGQLWEALGRPRVLALGKAADAECEVYEVPCSALPHPAWTRRFHNGRIDEYSALIEAAVSRQVQPKEFMK